MIDNCNVFAHCENTVGSFTCTCREGFIGDGQHCRGNHSNMTIQHMLINGMGTFCVR